MEVTVGLHRGQLEVFQDTSKYRVLACGRRYGKSSLGLWEMIRASCTYPGDTRDELMPPVVLGAMPTMNQAKQVLWQPLVRLVESYIPHVIEKVNHTDSTIWFKNGKPAIKIRGANDNNGDRLRGMRIYFTLSDEFQDWKAGIFENIIEPAMADTRGSRGLFTGTPKGRINHYYQFFEKAKTNPLFASFSQPTWVNPLIPREGIERARKILPPRVFRQEYEASFEDYPGKVFTELSSSNRYEGDFDRSILDLVVLGIDWGDYHPALATLGRDRTGTWYFLEGWSPGSAREPEPVTQPRLHQNILRLAKKWGIEYSYADPSRASDILAVRSLGDRHSLPGLRRCVAGYNKIQEGIAQVHSLITEDRLLFVPGLNDSVDDSIDGDLAYQLFEAYHRETNRDGSISEVPADGYFSHINDATRYALAVRNK